jgi:peptide/nickel transport system ATP-binding protein/oligopeptide transport system ATP-binding protein
MAEARSPLMQIEDLAVAFPNRNRRAGGSAQLRAVDGVTFDIQEGEVFGLVGESGSGKTTLGKAMLRLYRPTEGRLRFAGTDITRLGDGALRPYRRDLQMIFQDPLSSFNPRTRIGDAVALPLRLHRLCETAEVDREVDRLLARVGLSTRFKERFPHEMSGGQLQRVAIARALATQPRLIVADEPVSKLDVSIRAQILNLFRDVQQETGVALVFVTHDLRVARYLCDRVGVMFFGRLVEIGPTDALFARPGHPYTRQLLGTIEAGAKEYIAKEPAPPADATGCRYRSRCAFADDTCARSAPPLVISSEGRRIACHHYADF